MIKRWMTYCANCDLCKNDYKHITENMNYDSNDFVKELKEHRWFVDDVKVICPDCKIKLERIKML